MKTTALKIAFISHYALIKQCKIRSGKNLLIGKTF